MIVAEPTVLNSTKVECKLCNKVCETMMNLSRHLTNKHRVSPETYYDTYHKQDGDDMCVICIRKTSYIGFTRGYSKTCTHSCACILSRHELKGDPIRFKNFRATVAENQERIWAERKEDGSDVAIRAQIGETMTENNALLTDEERKARFGWLNKLSEDERETWKTEVMFKTGCHAWRETASDEQWRAARVKMNITKLRVCEDIARNLLDNLADKELYYTAVEYLTVVTYNRYKTIIDPYKLRGNDYHLDHKFSIIQGFIHGVPPEIIASVHNLAVIPKTDNLKKGSSCSITLEYLEECYYGK